MSSDGFIHGSNVPLIVLSGASLSLIDTTDFRKKCHVFDYKTCCFLHFGYLSLLAGHV
jgi:hypothetical protein